MNKKNIGITPGIMSILMVFIILVITAFATLYYIEARREYNVVNKSYNIIEEYYKADLEAMEYINNIKLNINNYRNGDIINKSLLINDRQSLEIVLEIENNEVHIREYYRLVSNGMEY
ncbi:MAG: hypothetical protein PUC68_02515 [Firmicutes bacterium]|nr:hypothetical protein [Bacillota bacterium]